jgi:hypothetical protein
MNRQVLLVERNRGKLMAVRGFEAVARQVGWFAEGSRVGERTPPLFPNQFEPFAQRARENGLEVCEVIPYRQRAQRSVAL